MSHAELAPTRRGLVAQAGAVVGTVLLPKRAVASGDDSALLALGKELDHAWAAERAINSVNGISDEDFDRIGDRVAAIVHEIERHPATTINGLIVKAQACSWCHSGDPFEDDSFSDQATTDVRLISSILRDLIAISGKPVFTS